jgi:hypothetical protein
MWLLAATTEANINRPVDTTEHTTGSYSPGDGRDGAHRYPGSSNSVHRPLKVDPPDGTTTTADTVTGDGLFDWWGQYLDWFFNTDMPLPSRYHITWFEGLLFCVALYFVGWFLGNILMGDD